MNSHKLYKTPEVFKKSKNKAQELPKTLRFLDEQADKVLMGTIFTLISNPYLKKALELSSKYLFHAAFFLRLGEWLFYTLSFKNANNQNIGKWTTFILKTITLPLVGLAIFGTALLAVGAAPIIFTAVMGVDVLRGLKKTAEFSIRSAMRPESDKIGKKYFKEKSN